jgi:hypothetical protein
VLRRGRAGHGPPGRLSNDSQAVERSPVLKSVNATYMSCSFAFTTWYFETETSGTSSSSVISTRFSFWYIGMRFFGSSVMRPLPTSRHICRFV